MSTPSSQRRPPQVRPALPPRPCGAHRELLSRLNQASDAELVRLARLYRGDVITRKAVAAAQQWRQRPPLRA